MLRAPWKKFWKLRGQEKRLRRQFKTAQRNVARADREVSLPLAFNTGMSSVTAFASYRTLQATSTPELI